MKYLDVFNILNEDLYTKLREGYNAFMDEYINLQHMKITYSNTHQDVIRYFIPHHPVIKESSKTTKLKVVFDASMKTDGGTSPSLNEIMITGPVVHMNCLQLL